MSELLKLLKEVGNNVYIHPWVDIRRPELVELGNHIAIDMGFVCTTQLKIGNYLHIAPHVTIIGGKTAKFTAGNFTSIAAGARIICYGDEHKGEGIVGALVPPIYRDKLVGGEVFLEDYAAIATNAIIFPGLTIAEGSVIGAGSVLKCNTIPWTIYAGNPAKPIADRPCEYILRKLHENPL